MTVLTINNLELDQSFQPSPVLVRKKNNNIKFIYTDIHIYNIFNDLPIFYIAYGCVLPEFDFDKSYCPTYGSTCNFVMFDVDWLQCAAVDDGGVVVAVVSDVSVVAVVVVVVFEMSNVRLFLVAWSNYWTLYHTCIILCFLRCWYCMIHMRVTNAVFELFFFVCQTLFENLEQNRIERSTKITLQFERLKRTREEDECEWMRKENPTKNIIILWINEQFSTVSVWMVSVCTNFTLLQSLILLSVS